MGQALLTMSNMLGHGSPIWRSLKILPRRDQKRILGIALLQTFMGFLDLAGVLVIGLLGALSVSGLQNTGPANRINDVLEFFWLTEFSFESQVLLLGSAAVVLLVGRTILSVIFTRRIMFFLSRRGAKISEELIARLLSQPLLVVQEKSTMESLYAVTSGVQVIVLNILSTAAVLIADFSLLLIMGIGLIAADPKTAVSGILIFSITGFFLHLYMSTRATKLGVQNTEILIKTNEKLVEVFSSYRELVVSNRRDFYAREIGKKRFELANLSAEINFMPFVSKYVIEATVVVGALLLGGVQLVFSDPSHAVGTMAIFLAAVSRVAPAFLRVQQGIIQIRGGLGLATPTLDLIDKLGRTPLSVSEDDSLDLLHEGFNAEIEIENVSLTYPGADEPAISSISLKINSGSLVAIVGPSGAGKTTITDILLGVLSPDEGRVLISGLPPLLAFAKWPGAVSYVPQDVVIAAGTVRENVGLGFPTTLATNELVSSAIKVANLEEFIMGLPNGIDSEVGERGARISGGQRQRIGIARAMFTRPRLLVLDEATSSLDGETEANISESILELSKSTTVVMIAHRLSTVRQADLVVYMNKKVITSGTFDEVRRDVPDFDRQAKLMGL